MNVIKLVLSVLILVFSQYALAFRCGHSIVTPGDYKEEVFESCGEPDYFNSHWERRGNVNHANVGTPFPYGRQRGPIGNFNYGQSYYQEEEILIEEWTYDMGRNKFYQHLIFENGRLRSVQSGRKHRR